MSIVEPVFAVEALNHIHLGVVQGLLVVRCLAVAVQVEECLAVLVLLIHVVFLVVK